MTNQEVIKAYTEDLIPITAIAFSLHVTRQSIYRLLRKLGVDTSKSRRIEVKCHYCEKTFLKRPCEVRRRKYHYCSLDCYVDCIAAKGQHVENNAGQCRARSAVSRHFDLKNDMIVHNENNDTIDNRYSNLRVFKNHSDHMNYHRGGDATPIWDGRTVPI